MDRTKAAAIVNDFFADMNPSLWNGSTSMPKSFDNRAWQYPLTDDVNLEITFVYNEEDGWCHYCDLVYQSDDSSFDMLSGYGIDDFTSISEGKKVFSKLKSFCLPGMSKLFCKDIVLITYNGKTLYKRAKK